MSAHWTPDTNEVRAGYGMGRRFPALNSSEDSDAEFNAWLAAHDAKVAADTAEKIAQAIEAIDERSVLDRKDALLMCARIASDHGGGQA